MSHEMNTVGVWFDRRLIMSTRTVRGYRKLVVATINHDALRRRKTRLLNLISLTVNSVHLISIAFPLVVLNGMFYRHGDLVVGLQVRNTTLHHHSNRKLGTERKEALSTMLVGDRNDAPYNPCSLPNYQLRELVHYVSTDRITCIVSQSYRPEWITAQAPNRSAASGVRIATVTSCAWNLTAIASSGCRLVTN